MHLVDEFQLSVVDGVPVVGVAGHPPLAASLVFRVGRADETFPDGGITHLLEHLVMRAVGRLPIEVGAHVSAHFTAFDASGSPRHVVDFLHRVCRQLQAPDTSAIDVERSVLVAESGGAAAGPAAEAAALRYGCRGAGLLAFREVGLGRATAEMVSSWAQRWFNRENAVLALTGPVPDDLRLSLPAGSRAPLVPPRSRALDLPAWEPDSGGTAVAMPLPTAGGMDLAIGRLLGRAAEEQIRHERGLAYDVGVDGLSVDSSTSEVAVYADNDADQAPAVASLLLDVVDRFCQDGPTLEDLQADVAEALEALSDTRSLVDAVSAAARDLLVGARPLTPAQQFEMTRGRTQADIREAVRAGAARTIVLVPGESGPERPGLRRMAASSHPVPHGRELRPKLLRPVPRGARLVYGDAGVALRLPDGDLVALWEEVVGVSILSDGTHVVQSADGPAVPVGADDFRGASDVVAQLRRRLPGGLFVMQPDGELPR